ncbi:G protein pathway suppressor 2-like [Watersipora subatra]|uniref:G protein pathway suppressor 2-like n=1 Tax=Watersipora subatra TaxID=2589382 RepID=UPI00355B182F
MPALIERRKMTRTTYQALKRHILRDREKRKQEHEADLALERQRKEAERRKRLENENKNSLQQTKDELVRLDKQLEELKKAKSKLFAQLKRILESENTRKVNEKKHETQLYPSASQSGHANPHFLSGTGHMGRPVMFKPTLHSSMPRQNAPVHATASGTPQKRQRSISPTPNPAMSGVFSFHPGNQPVSMYGSSKYSSTQDGYTGYSAHSQTKPTDSHSHAKLLDQSQIHTSTADNYHSHQMLQPNIDEQTTSQRISTSTVKGSIVTGYAMHPNNSAHQAPRGRLPPVRGSAPQLPPGKSMYQRDSMPYYN